MTWRATTPLAVTTAVLLAAAVLVPERPSAAVDGQDDYQVLLDRETLNVRMDADGDVRETNLLAHLTVDGQGRHTIEDPAATSRLRSMSGFTTPDADPDHDVVRWDVDLDGEPVELRSMSTHRGEVPAEVEVDVTLDGEPITAEEARGRDGRLEVRYTLRNTSHVPTEIRYPDEGGAEVTEEVDVPLPLVGTVETTLDQRFDDIDVGSAIVAGDGEGGTRLQWSLPLFPPLGETERELTFSADVTDAELPSVRATLVPAGAHQSPLDTGMASFERITDALGDIEDGAGQLDDGALELASGTSELLAGLAQIADGSDELAAGVGEARAGSGELADGADQLDDGASELAGGARQLDDGAGDAAAGAREVLEGIRQVEEGLSQLTAPDAVPAALDGVEQLFAGANDVADVLDTLLDGGEVTPPGEDAPVEYPGLAFIADGAQELGDGLCDTADGFFGVVAPQLREACDGARQLEEGIRGTHEIVAGVDDGVGDTDDPDTLLGGLDALRQGLTDAATGLDQLAAGASELEDGQSELADGLDELDAGAGDLADGSQELQDGTSELSAGARELADGLREAEDGARQLEDGAGEARDGAGELDDGAQELRGTGTAELAGQVADGRTEQSRDLAIFRATAQRGVEDGMPYGAPDGADGVAVYVFDLVGTAVGEPPGAAPAALAALLLAAASTTLVLARRRLAA